MSLARLAALALVALLGAGCLGGSSPPPTPVSTSTPTTEIAPAAAGSSTSLSPSSAPAPVPKDTPVAYSGKTGTAACAHAQSTAQCAEPDGGSETHHAIALSARPVSLKGSVAYTTSAPGTFGVFLCVEHADGAFECPAPIEGASPLAFEWDLSGFADAKSLLLGTYQSVEPPASLPAQAWARTPAEFKVDGTLTTLSA